MCNLCEHCIAQLYEVARCWLCNSVYVYVKRVAQLCLGAKGASCAIVCTCTLNVLNNFVEGKVPVVQ